MICMSWLMGAAVKNELITIFHSKSRALGERQGVYLRARSALSPISKLVWSNLDVFAAQGVGVFVIFHKIQNLAAATRAIASYRRYFGAEASRNVLLADFKEVGPLREEFQLGRHIAWTGNRLSSVSGAEVTDGVLNHEVSAGEFAMFKSTFGVVWAAASKTPLAAELEARSELKSSGQRGRG